MKTSILKLIQASFFVAIVLALVVSPMMSIAQEATDQDTVEVIEDNSSAFNDSVQFDDMEPVFYEAADDEEVTSSESGGTGNLWLYAGIAIVLVVVLIVLKKAGKKKA
jgi:Na+/H+ antiporter NhaC